MSSLAVELAIAPILHDQFVEISASVLKIEKLAWPQWISDFTNELRRALTMAVEDLQVVETDYWRDKGQKLSSVSPQDLIDDYERRIGRQISDIGETTKRKTLKAIADWYNTPDATTEELVENLKYWYSDERAATIANTEVAFITSQVSLQAMQDLSVEQFNVDIGSNGCRQICLPIAQNNPYRIGAPMPPFHPECDCSMEYGSEL